MTDRQEAKLNMFQEVLNTCRNYNQVYAGIPVFVQAVRELEDCISEIRLEAQRQAASKSKGVTAGKNIVLDELNRTCIKVAKLLYVYAFRTKNHELLPKVSINKKMLYQTHENDVITIATNVANEASTHAGELVDYGLDDKDLTELRDAIDQFKLLHRTPQQVIGKRKLHTQSLKQLFADADSVLYDQLDNLINKFRDSNPDFFMLYKNSRNVINSAARKGKNNDKEDNGNENDDN